MKNCEELINTLESLFRLQSDILIRTSQHIMVVQVKTLLQFESKTTTIVYIPSFSFTVVKSGAIFVKGDNWGLFIYQCVDNNLSYRSFSGD